MALRVSTGLRNAMMATGSLQDTMVNGVLCIYSGTQPTTADDAESGTLLCKITVSSGTFAAGTATNGINMATAATSGTLPKSTSEVWSGVNVATGTAGYYRYYDNTYTTGASTTANRIDGAIATSGAQLNMSSTSLTSGATLTLDSFTLTLPAA